MQIPIVQQDLNWEGFDKFLNECEVELEYVNFRDPRIKGMALPEGIFVSKNFSGNQMYMFVVLHELAHYKRYQKIGAQEMAEFILDGTFNEAFAKILHEERLADRYAKMVFRKLNGFDFPDELTQELHDENNVANLAHMWAQIRPQLKFMVETSEFSYYDTLKRNAINE